MTARLTLLLRKVQAAMAAGKTFDEAIARYLLTPAEVEELATHHTKCQQDASCTASIHYTAKRI